MARKKATLTRRKAAPSFTERLAALDTIQWVGIAIVMASEPAADVESGVVDLVLADVKGGHLWLS